MAKKFYKLTEEKMDDFKKREVNFWILSGSQENWRKGIAERIWGVKEGLKNSWDKLKPRDILLFYVTSPISGIIGFGRLETKFKQDKPLWPDEILKTQVIYPFRFEFKIDHPLPERDWHKDRIDISGLKLNYWAGLNFVKNVKAIEQLNQIIKQKWNVELPLEELILREERVKYEAKKELAHRDYQEMFKKIGELQRFLAYTEYPMEKEKLDVVWMRVAGGSPTYVFEVQIGGDIYHALGKLKHAWDKWNSNVFLITDKTQISRVNELLQGTFHEISPHLKIISAEEAQKLFKSKTEVKQLEEKFGILKY